MSGQVRRWTDEEHGFIQANPDLTNRELAEQLGRSRQAVEHKRRSLSEGWSPEREQWTHDEDFAVRTTGHLTAEQVAELIGRTASAVKNRRHKLGVVALTNKDPNQVGARPLVAKTCSTCGLLLSARWFATERHDGREYWTQLCRRCASDRTYENRKKRGDVNADRRVKQAITERSAERKQYEWQESDHAVLADPDLTIFEKAISLKRTYHGTAAAVIQFGYRSKVGLGNPQQDQWFIHNPNAPQEAAS